MEGLFKAVTLGVYPPINQKYSKELSHMIKLMLQQKPKSRPSAEKVLSSALIQKKVEELHLESIKADETNQELMKTIRLPKKLHSFHRLDDKYFTRLFKFNLKREAYN